MSSYKNLKDDSILGAGADYLEGMYEDVNIGSVEVHGGENWQNFFDNVAPTDLASKKAATTLSNVRRQFLNLKGSTLVGSSSEGNLKQNRVTDLINSYRSRGHESANIDPLEMRSRRSIIEMSLEGNGLIEEDLGQLFEGGILFANQQVILADIIERLEKVYCGSIGFEYMHIAGTTEKEWLRSRIEGTYNGFGLSNERKRWLLQKLTAAESLEKYLHTQYVGQKRFSLEGAESLIASIGAIVEEAGNSQTDEIVIGMAHRGRLNVLVNILGKLPQDLFEEFEGKVDEELLAGDVKYHQGFSTDLVVNGHPVHILLAFNPSHLEIVGPVVQGSVRARQERRRSTGLNVLPLLIHGDAAFAGQGVVMEMLNMSGARGYSTKGTIHLVVNNQIGFTTSLVADARSTMYCTDVGKMLNIPIIHVNADDPEAVYFASRMAFEYRQAFSKDVILDLVCYRRHGHNEADEPAVTQPVMYSKIAKLPATRALFEKKLVASNDISLTQSEQMGSEYRESLKRNLSVAEFFAEEQGQFPLRVAWGEFIATDHTVDTPVDTGVSKNLLQELAVKVATVPADFEIHSRARNILKQRMEMANEEKPLDWGMAENLAYATLLSEGTPIRVTGQDVRRGTFFHRQATYHNINERVTYTPLQKLYEEQPRFTIIDSLLSEEAVLAFEYGYSTTAPNSLVVWEAQFGDFANGAQVVIDQFITSGEAKWNRFSGLVILLPHGYEGQGPEHSSARPERFFQLCAEDNIQLVVPTTPAQVFHLLRRQVHLKMRRPLVIMSPKSLLRSPFAVSRLDELTQGQFQPVIDDPDVKAKAKVTEVVICSGKVYYEIKQRQQQEGLSQVAIIRLERYYPVPYRELLEVIKSYKNAKVFRWCQEEPKNQGAWRSIRHRIDRILIRANAKSQEVTYTGRFSAASPAAGSLKVHKQQQQDLIEQALGIKPSVVHGTRWRRILGD